MRRGNVDLRPVLLKLVSDVLFVQLRNDLFGIRRVEPREQRHHFRRTDADRQVNQESQQEQRDGAHRHQPRHSEVFQSLKKRIHSQFRLFPIHLSKNITGVIK